MPKLPLDRLLPPLFALTLLAPLPARGADSTGRVPLVDLGPTELYQGFPGGLYPGGNEIPPDHLAVGLAQVASIRPRNRAGQPDPCGRIGFVSVGMSNASMEWQAFERLARSQPGLSPAVTLVNGAQGGASVDRIADPAAPYWQLLDERVAAAGLSPGQLQAVWFLEAIASPHAPFPESAERLRDLSASALRILRERYPNLRLVFLSSRIYAGWATTPLNPEPWAYESGFAMRWLIEEQRDATPGFSVDEIPWLAWGAYPWADGLRARGDGLRWERDDLGDDGTHPSTRGSRKVADLLLAALRGSPVAGWLFSPADACGSGLSAPSPPAVEALGDGSHRLSWEAATSPNRFRLEGRPPFADWSLLAEQPGTAREAVIESLAPATRWELRIVAVDAEGNEAASGSSPFTTAGLVGSCSPDETTLCLGDGRFSARVRWRDAQGGAGDGGPLELPGRAGGFWFFTPTNLELVAKILDGRAVNDHFWLFAATLTDVEWELTVVDGESGAAASWHGEPGRLSSFSDLEAF